MKTKTKRLETNGVHEPPTKGGGRSVEAPADADRGEPQELAKSFTASEAKHILDQKITPIMEEMLDTEIQGDDLIVHRWSEKAVREMLQAQQQSKEEKKMAKMNRAKKNPAEDFEGAKYNFDGKDWFPANGVKKAMVSAGFGLGIAKSIIQRCVFVAGDLRRDYVEVKYARCVMREDAVKVGPWNNRTADLRYRPEYQNWTIRLRLTFRPNIITADQVLTLLEHAGYSVGIGEWRPEKDGQAGRFRVVRRKEKKHG